ncbi:hypothetical protein [Streptomyces sp. NPDC001568]|uniref:hypothetical protein n=1 Tax=Streptomyces sp. NPDC001568 TaxID=3364588 RepID=UPI0036961EA8
MTTLMVFAGQAHAEDINPVGIGDLFWSPGGPDIPDNERTMYETYEPNRWKIDADLSFYEGIDATGWLVVNFLMAILMVVGLAMTVITGWVFRFTSIPELEGAISGMIGGASQSLMEFILPSCLVVGGFVAFVQHKKNGGGGGLNQIAWVLISGVVSVSLLTSPQTWVSGIDSARQVGASVTMTATAEGLGDGSSDYPFALKHTPKFNGNGRDTLLRKSQDSVWRGFVATPWCLAEFGSMAVCEKFGRQVLDQGTNDDKREDYLEDNVTGGAVGEASVEWWQGDSVVGRIVVLIPAIVVALLFAILLLVLAFTSLAAFLGALLLLLTGAFFACLWVIPGRPRQWGLAWFDQLLARTLESFIATLVLGAVLSAQTATMQMFDKYGWLPTMGLSVALAVVAFQFRSVLAQIFGVRGTSAGGNIAGLLASKALNLGGKKTGSGTSGRNLPTGGGGGGGRPTGGGGGGGGGGRSIPSGTNGRSDTDVTLTRVPHQRQPVPLPPGENRGQGHKSLPPGGYQNQGQKALPPGEVSERDQKSLPPGGQQNDDRAPATTGNPSRNPVPPARHATRIPAPRQPLPAGSPNAPISPTAVIPPSPVMRSETGSQPNYAFRQAPVPRAPGSPKVIQGTVIRSTPARPPARQQAGAPPRRPVPAARSSASPSPSSSGRQS